MNAILHFGETIAVKSKSSNSSINQVVWTVLALGIPAITLFAGYLCTVAIIYPFAWLAGWI